MATTQDDFQGLRDSVAEMLESAKAVKGEEFANAAAGIFELMQVSHAAGVVKELAAEKGADVSHQVNSMATVIGVASSRFLIMLTKEDAAQAMALAQQMSDRRIDAFNNFMKRNSK